MQAVRYCLPVICAGLLLHGTVLAQKGPPAKPGSSVQPSNRSNDEWTDGDSFRVRLPDVHENRIRVLNVAGSRASKEPTVGEFVTGVLRDTLFPQPTSWLGGPGEG